MNLSPIFKTIIMLLAVATTVQAQTYQWAHGYGGYEYDESQGIVIDSSGNAIITGNFYDTVDFDPGPGLANLASKAYYDVFVAKYDPSGNYVWAIGIESVWDVYALGIAIDDSDNIFITGWFNDSADFDPGPGVAMLIGNGSEDMYIAKYDSNGNYLWAIGIGGVDYDEGFAIDCDGQGNVCITGFFETLVDFDPDTGVANIASLSGTDIFVAKYDGNGNYLWAHGFGEVGGGSHIGLDIHVDNSDNIIATGQFDGTVDFEPGAGVTNLTTWGFGGAHFLKLDPNGALIWAKALSCDFAISGYGIASDAQNNLILSGDFAGIADLDPGVDSALFTGQGFSASMFMAKYDSNGVYLWGHAVGGPSWERASCVTADSAGNIWVSGNFTDTVDFDPDTVATNIHSSHGQRDIFVSKYDATGNYIWTKSIGGIYTDEIYSIKADNQGNVFMAGLVSDTLDVDPGLDTTIYISYQSTADIFISKFGNCNFSATFTQNNSVICAGDSITFIYSGDSAASYIWKENGVAFSGSKNVTRVFAIAGTFGISVESVSGSCSSSASVLITVNEAYTNINQSTAICMGDSILVGGAYQTIGGIYIDSLQTVNGCDSIISTSLSFSAPDSSTILYPAMCYGDGVTAGGTFQTTSGTYYDTYTKLIGAACDSVVTTILSVEPPVDVILFVLLDGNAHASANSALYQWMDCANDSLIPGATEQDFKAPDTSLYAVIVTYIGCKDTSECSYLFPVGMNELNALEGVVLYPNPVTNQLTFEFENNGNRLITVYNSTGQKVASLEAVNKKAILNT
ncbi:MAG: hypothetical protein JKX73_01670, partial [Flavobacteriales bacterium]|nr:hypothetical protein [Flavobacteriales bacterium]